MNRNDELLYDEEGDYYYIKPRPSDTDDWTGPDLVEGPEDWVYDDEIPFDESDYFELKKRIDYSKSSDDIEEIIKIFIQEKGIEDILHEKGIKY